MPLSDTTIRNIKPSTKTLKVFDGNGLHLYITPNGAKLWRLKYRWMGKENTLSFGTYPIVSLNPVS